MSTKHHYTDMERDYHDAFTYLRIMRRIERNRFFVGDYYDRDRHAAYWEAEYCFNDCNSIARVAARRSMSMRGAR